MKFIRRHSSLTDVSFTQALHSETQAPLEGAGRGLRVLLLLQQPLRVQRALQVRRIPGRLLQREDHLHLLLTD